MKLSYGRWRWYWNLRILPSIEFTNNDKMELWEHYGYKYDITLRWLPYWIAIELVEHKERKGD